MKDILPLPVVQGATGRDVSTAGGIKAAVNTSGTASGSASPLVSTADKASFLDSLQDLLSSSSTINSTPVLASSGGKDLPLAEQTAESIPPALLSIPADMHAQQDTALLTVVPQGTVTATAERTDSASTTVALSELSKSGLSKLPAQAGPMPVDSSAGDVALQVSDRVRVRAMDIALSSQAELTLNKADALISSSSPLVRMQLATLDSSQKLNSIDEDIAVKVGLTPQPKTRQMAEPQLALKAVSVVAESDQLFTSRMQLSAFNQPSELAGQKQALDAMLIQTQAASTDTLNASFTRLPIPQTVLSAESLATTPSQPTITETFGRADWGQGMGKQILWMVSQNVSSAEFRLNPANLGPLEVRIDMDNDQVNVAFSSRHADVRDAVEQALPKLREMFEDKGLNLSDADVSEHSFAEQRENAFEQAAKREAGIASNMSFVAEDDQMADHNHQHMENTGSSAMLNQGQVDYYI